MLNLFKGMVFSFREDLIKLNIELITEGIQVPKLSEEFNTFSLQGCLTLYTPRLIKVKRITLQLSGFLNNFKIYNKLDQNHILLENSLNLLDFSTYFNIGGHKIAFELALPRSMPSNFKSEFFALNYEILALVDCEDRQLSFRFPFQVHNTHQVPHQELLLSQYNHDGSIPSFINYSISFPKRSFVTGEMVNFKVSVNLMNKTTLNYIEARVYQKCRFINVFQQASEDEKCHEVTLYEAKKLLKNRLITQSVEFNISLTKASSIGAHLPTMDTECFEITHTVEIHLNYQLEGQSPKVRFIRMPVALTVPAPLSLMTELPTYDKIHFNSTKVLTVEHPPPYNYMNSN